MRRKLFLVSLVLVFAFTMAIPLQAMAGTCNSKLNYGDVNYKVYFKVIKYDGYKYSKDNNSKYNNSCGKKPSTDVVAKYKDYSSKVYQIEKMLSKLGYKVGVVSKFFDYNTFKAVKQFQKDNNLPVTGVVDQATYQKIKDLYSKLGTNDDGNKPIPNPDPKPNEPTVPGDTDPGNGSDPGNTSDNINGLTADEQKMINLVNQERTSRGLPALKVDMTLVKTARMKSSDMIKNGYFAHQSPTYGSPFDLMKSQGVTYRYAGENLAGASSVERAHTNLMNSPGHRANILNPNFTHIGIGIIDGGPYGKMFTQHFIGK